MKIIDRSKLDVAGLETLSGAEQTSANGGRRRLPPIHWKPDPRDYCYWNPGKAIPGSATICG